MRFPVSSPPEATFGVAVGPVGPGGNARYSFRMAYHSKPKPERTFVAQTRHCLRCSEQFESRWSGERICPRCKGSPGWRAMFDLAGELVQRMQRIEAMQSVQATESVADMQRTEPAPDIDPMPLIPPPWSTGPMQREHPVRGIGDGSIAESTRSIESMQEDE